MTITFNTISLLQNQLNKDRALGKKISFVPTMGALHEGHLLLVNEAQKVTDVTVMSIFVNPTQFNDKSDLEKYPRTIESDTEKVREIGLDYLYVPSEQEIYPPGLETSLQLDLQHLDKVMEGEFRPGHFQGVCQVVKRLLDLVQPDVLVMGQKDFQQFTIIQFMINQLHLKAKLIVVPTKRNKKGLALSSRNARLTPKGRVKASVIFRTMEAIKQKIKEKSISSLRDYGMKRLSKAGLNPEYVSIVNGNTLQPVSSINSQKYVVVCVAAWLEGVRLIDNLILIKDE
jgi:pantoate--beta-alanine ligase